MTTDFTFCGLSTIELMQRIEFWDNMQPYIKVKTELITREEAIKRLLKVYEKLVPHSMSRDNAEFQIAVAEALGLIKFKEEEFLPTNAYRDAIDYLNSGEGYRLDKVGKYHKMIKGLVDIIKNNDLKT